MAVGGKKKGTRFHSRWRVDQDYLDRLPPKERAWLEKFNSEYYRAEFEGEPLHAAGDMRRELYNAQNSAQRDVVTAPATEVITAMTSAVSNRPSLRVRFYVAEDYRMLAIPRSPRQIEEDLNVLFDDAPQSHDLVQLFRRRLRSAS